MQVIERMIMLFEKQNKKPIDLCRRLDIQTSTMSSWKKRCTNPPVEYMPEIARFFGISLSYLITGEEERTSNSKSNISSDENTLLELYRALPEDKKHEFIGELKGFLRAINDTSKYVDGEKRLSV